MNDLLLKLRAQLVSMIEEIDNDKISFDDTIIIKNEDLKWIKHVKKLNPELHLFEYKNGVKFTLNLNPGRNYETFNRLLKGTLEILILNKREYVWEKNGHSINYDVEDKIKTALRNSYSSVEEEYDENFETQYD